LQALPSILAAQVLSPRPGSRVLDMCAAPGGKTTWLAAAMGDEGRVVALDRTTAKVEEIRSLARDFGLTSVEAHRADATQAVRLQQQHTEAEAEATAAAPSSPSEAATQAAAAAAEAKAAAAAGAAMQAEGAPAAGSSALHHSPSSPLPALGPPPYHPASFDYILLDPPCSALGLRPRLLHAWSLKQLRALAAYQRSLLHTAVQLLAPGGELVYCTCTINPEENEGNVAWVLDRYPGTLQLLPAAPLLGLPGLTGADPGTGARWLRQEEAELVQRFDPGVLLPGRKR
ncbi:hypothetical protein Agub_g7505, partial [Astrephomene gubernaculifera]